RSRRHRSPNVSATSADGADRSPIDSLMIIDYLANCFLPDRQAVWDGAITRAGLPLKVRKGDEDSYATGPEMVARMDELGIATILLPSCDIGAHGTVDPYDYEHV